MGRSGNNKVGEKEEVWGEGKEGKEMEKWGAGSGWKLGMELLLYQVVENTFLISVYQVGTTCSSVYLPSRTE